MASYRFVSHMILLVYTFLGCFKSINQMLKQLLKDSLCPRSVYTIFPFFVDGDMTFCGVLEIV